MSKKLTEQDVERLSDLYAKTMYETFKKEKIDLKNEIFFAMNNPYGYVNLQMEVVTEVLEKEGFDISVLKKPDWYRESPELQDIIDNGDMKFGETYFVDGFGNNAPEEGAKWKPEFAY